MQALKEYFIAYPQVSHESVVAVNALYSAGARLFRLSDENRPAETKGFFDRQLSLDDLLSHLERGHRLGIEPQSINTVAVDVDDGDPSSFIHAFRPLSVCRSKTPGRVHAYYAHDAGKILSRPFSAPVFKISGDLKHARSYVALYDAARLANDLSRGLHGVPFQEVERALVTGPLAAQGGQRGPLTPPAGSNASPGFETPSPGRLRHTWLLSKLIAARADGMDPKAIHRYAVELHGALSQPPDDVPHFFPRSEALSIADFVCRRSWSVEHQRAAGIRSGQARRSKSAHRDKRILDLLSTGLSIRRTAARLDLSRQVVQKAKDRQRAKASGRRGPVRESEQAF